MEREVGGGIGMGNTCKPMAVSFQCMTKFTTNKKKKNFLHDASTSLQTGCEHPSLEPRCLSVIRLAPATSSSSSPPQPPHSELVTFKYTQIYCILTPNKGIFPWVLLLPQLPTCFWLSPFLGASPIWSFL